MKIVYVFSTLAKTGGTERMITEKANYLAEQFGYDVTIITCFQLEKEENFFLLSNKVKQINLVIPFFSQYKYQYPSRLLRKWQMNKLLNKRINETVKEIDPDILIGVSRFKADFISSIKCRAKKVIECHEAKYNTVYDASEKRIFLSSLYIKVYRFFYFRAIERNADSVVSLTKDDKNQWKRAKHTEVIPNFSTMPISHYSDCTNKRIIAAGRLAWEKGFGRLIEAWIFVYSRHPDWHLDIFGEGRMYNTLQTLVKIYNAKNVYFHSVTPNISQEYANSSICAVSSYFEGFSLVLLEAMKHGVPCVAFDCPFGPRNIINDGYDGFLVENGETRLFAERLCRLIEDKELRMQFSKRAIEKAKSFDVDVIMNKWRNLFEQIRVK